MSQVRELFNGAQHSEQWIGTWSEFGYVLASAVVQSYSNVRTSPILQQCIKRLCSAEDYVWIDPAAIHVEGSSEKTKQGNLATALSLQIRFGPRVYQYLLELRSSQRISQRSSVKIPLEYAEEGTASTSVRPLPFSEVRPSALKSHLPLRFAKPQTWSQVWRSGREMA